MKRVAIFTHGGIAPPSSPMEIPALAGLVRRLSRDFNITVYTVVKPDGFSNTFRCGDASVKFVRSSSGNPLPVTIARMVQEFLRDHRSDRFDLVHGLWGLPGGMAAVLAARITDLPSAVTLLGGETADIGSIGYGNLIRPASRQATLWTCRNATLLTCLTSYQAQQIRSWLPPRLISAIPFGAETDFYSAFPPSVAPIPPLRILHIGSINAVKDQRTLLRAFRRAASVIDSRLTIVGEDTLGGTLSEFSRELGISDRVSFTGYLAHEDVRRHLFSSHVLLQSSRHEAQGVVFAEAAAAGLPICGTRVGLLADLGDTFAEVAEPGDAEGLAAGICRIASDPNRRNSIRSCAHAWAQRHTADWTATQWNEAYRGAMGEIPGAPSTTFVATVNSVPLNLNSV